MTPNQTPEKIADLRKPEERFPEFLGEASVHQPRDISISVKPDGTAPAPYTDEVHGEILVTPVEQEVIKTELFQRLAGIQQTTGAYSLRSQTMDHDRLSHSIGVMHIAGRIAEQIGLNEKKTQEVRLAGLFHDVGHLPYSHALEDVIRQRLGFDHDQIAGARLRACGVHKILEAYNVDYDAVMRLLTKADKLSFIIPELADRMDYVLRDSQHTHLSASVKAKISATVEKLIDNLTRVRGEVALMHDGQDAAKEFMAHRSMLYAEFSRHPVSIVIDSILEKEIKRGIEQGDWEDQELLAMALYFDNSTLFHSFGAETRELLADRHIEKHLHPAFAVRFSDLTDEGREFVRSKAFERKVSNVLGRILPDDAFMARATPDFDKALSVSLVVTESNGKGKPLLKPTTIEAVTPDEHKFAYVVLWAGYQGYLAEAQALLANEVMAPYLKPSAKIDCDILGNINHELYRE